MVASGIEEARRALNQAISLARKLSDDIAVFVVANLKADATYDSQFDRSTEYFNEAELDEITNAFRASGFYAGVFIGEEDFLKWVQGGGLKHFHKRQTLVYSTAQSGTGPGRKSLVPAFCSLHGLVSLGSDAYVVSLSRHKSHVNAIMAAHGIPCPPCWTYLPNGRWLAGRSPTLGEQVLAKSCFESASIGVDPDSAFIYREAEDARLSKISQGLKQPVVVQRFIRGREFEVPVIVGDRPLALLPVGVSLEGEQILGERFLHFDIVAHDTYDFYDSDDASLVHALRGVAESVFEVLGINGFGRVDFRVDLEGNAYVTDVSTSPHLISHSAFGHRFRTDGLDTAALMAALVGLRLTGRQIAQGQPSVQN
jgi:D-alanine-D-alanine ligase